MPRRRTDDCPHCGAEFPAGRLACPECGSDAETGWSEDGLTGYAHGLPDEFTDEDYDQIVREIGGPPRRPSTAAVLKGVGLALLILFMIWALVLA